MNYNTMEDGRANENEGCLRNRCCQWLYNLFYACLGCLRALFSALCCCIRKEPLPDVHIIGTDRRALQDVEEMLKVQLAGFKFATFIQTATGGDVFLQQHAYNRVILVCNYNHGNNIISDQPEQNDISRIYQEEKRQQVDVMVMYTGVPIDYTCGCDQYFSPRFLNLMNTQPKVGNLMRCNRFMSITQSYGLSPNQTSLLVRWMKNVPEQGVIQVISKDMSFVGFSRRTLEQVENMFGGQIIDRYQIVLDKHLLTKNDDFKPDRLLKKKVLLVCNYTQRDNILGEPPDEGEMFHVFTQAEERGIDTILMYAGVPQKYYSPDELFSQSYNRLLRSQPKLKKLMDEGRFMVVDATFSLNHQQKRRLGYWLQSDADVRGGHTASISHVDESYSSYQ